MTTKTDVPSVLRLGERQSSDTISKVWFMCLYSFYDAMEGLCDTPEARRTDVLSRGTPSELSGTIPVGGQHPPRSRAGTRLEGLGWETSVTINDSVMKAFLYNRVQWPRYFMPSLIHGKSVC